MIYRVDNFIENNINPITGNKYDESWIVLILSDSCDYQYMCGSNNNCAYTVKISRLKCSDWAIHVHDFIEFNQNINKNIILVMSENELSFIKNNFHNQNYNDSYIRENEPKILIHSTTMSNWTKIKNDGVLKSWNALKSEHAFDEDMPIGSFLGDPSDFSDYIMFGSGTSGEIVVASKQAGKIVMDVDKEYLTGARLYFDSMKMAEDGILLRDGCHMKVKDAMPLEPYLIWVATWKNVGLNTQMSTPNYFAKCADEMFMQLNNYNVLDLI